MSRNVIRAERIFLNRQIAVRQQRAQTREHIGADEVRAFHKEWDRAVARITSDFVPFNKEDCPHV